MKDNNKLKVLHISYNAITDDVAEAMTTELATNKSLVRLWMQWRNQTRASQGIARASSYTALPSALRPN